MQGAFAHFAYYGRSSGVGKFIKLMNIPTSRQLCNNLLHNCNFSPGVCKSPHVFEISTHIRDWGEPAQKGVSYDFTRCIPKRKPFCLRPN